jgi:hypothetical protein
MVSPEKVSRQREKHNYLINGHCTSAVVAMDICSYFELNSFPAPFEVKSINTGKMRGLRV